MTDTTQWWIFKAYNTASRYGWGTESEALQLCNVLNGARQINCIYAVRACVSMDQSELEALEHNPEAFNIDEELTAMREGAE